jgi:hypothetical protein
MSKLDGSLGGTFIAQTRLDCVEIELDDGNILEQKIPIKNIIYNMLYEIGKELPQNIIINDMESIGYELCQYNGSEIMYVLYSKED